MHLVVGKQHGPELDGLHCVGVVTDQSEHQIFIQENKKGKQKVVG